MTELRHYIMIIYSRYKCIGTADNHFIVLILQTSVIFDNNNYYHYYYDFIIRWVSNSTSEENILVLTVPFTAGITQ